jgi:hypothetical protein
MSVIITMRIAADPAKFEEEAQKNAGAIGSVMEQAKGNGLIAHRFYGTDDGEILAIDEWPDAESFHAFFQGAQGEIGPIMQAIGATQAPKVTVLRPLEIGDEYGWGA